MHSLHMYRKESVVLLLVVVLLAVLGAPVKATIYSQDGLGGGPVKRPAAIEDPVSMTSYDAWPTAAGFAKGIFAFCGGAHAAGHVWLPPFFASNAIKINLATGDAGVR